MNSVHPCQASNKRWAGRCRMGVAALVLTLSLAGCASQSQSGGRRINTLRPQPPPNLELTELTIQRRELTAALQQENLVKRIRVVEILNSPLGGSALLPEYRLFDIDSGSPYHVLGLRNADILVAANDRIVANPEVFRTYIRLLATENEAQIEIRRAGKPILIKYRFVE